MAVAAAVASNESERAELIVFESMAGSVDYYIFYYTYYIQCEDLCVFTTQRSTYTHDSIHMCVCVRVCAVRTVVAMTLQSS